MKSSLKLLLSMLVAIPLFYSCDFYFGTDFYNLRGTSWECYEGNKNNNVIRTIEFNSSNSATLYIDETRFGIILKDAYDFTYDGSYPNIYLYDKNNGKCIYECKMKGSGVMFVGYPGFDEEYRDDYRIYSKIYY